ncbi:hypothetical protein ACH41E_09080 [Streptomyces sp. NPDC020412]|uniref:hypothetical protein n=1 Tax=Streptomyces sp. NPDC020412 TaxID=3365073 RepID=UPI0037BAD478
MSSLSSPPGAPGAAALTGAPGECTGAGVRLLRAAVFAAVCVALSAAGHAIAACAGVPWWTVAVGLAGTFVLVLPFTGRARSLPAVALVLGLGQLALHALFGAGQQHQVRIGPTADDLLLRMAAKLVCGVGAAPLSAEEARQVVAAAGIAPPTAPAHPAHPAQEALAQPELLPSLPMLLAHLLAALATGWLLRHGDLALLRLIRLSTSSAEEARELVAEAGRLRSLRAALTLVRALCSGLVRLPAPGVRPARAVDDRPPPATAEALQHAVIRRGPPAPRYALAA